MMPADTVAASGPAQVRRSPSTRARSPQVAPQGVPAWECTGRRRHSATTSSPVAPAQQVAASWSKESSSVVVRSSTFANNKVTSWGGGIDNFGGSLNVSASTFIDDAAGGAGGGVVTETGGTQTLTNDTFATDSAHTGGAVANTTTTNHTTMVDDTLSHDTATGHGDGVWAATGSVTFSDTIFDAAGCAKAGLASLADHGYNVATTHTCTSAPTSISTSSTIGLGHLAANTSTGPQTMAITPTSSAFEVVPPWRAPSR